MKSQIIFMYSRWAQCFPWGSHFQDKPISPFMGRLSSQRTPAIVLVYLFPHVFSFVSSWAMLKEASGCMAASWRQLTGRWWQTGRKQDRERRTVRKPKTRLGSTKLQTFFGHSCVPCVYFGVLVEQQSTQPGCVDSGKSFRRVFWKILDTIYWEKKNLWK